MRRGFGGWFGRRFGQGGVGLEHALDFGCVEVVAVEQEESGFPAIFAGEQEAEGAAAEFEGFEFVLGQGEAFAQPEEVHGRGDVADAAGEAEVFGAAAGEEVRVVAGDGGHGFEDFVQVVGERDGEEVVDVRDLVTD